MLVEEIINGTRGGVVVAILRPMLALLAKLYGLVVSFRNRLYDWGWLASTPLSVPVICLGNITAGGTGKTPMVIWICHYLQGHGLKVALLSRGYKGDSHGDNDEMKLMGDTLDGVTMVVDADRVRGGRRAIEEHKAEILVLDDGYQHRRLKRDLDIVMIDCLCPFGYDRLLPRGLLREPIDQLRRADVVVLSRSDMIDKSQLNELKDRIERLCNGEVIMARHEPTGLYNAQGGKVALEKLKGKKVLAFCGIGNPPGFIATLEKLGARIVAKKFFPDHTKYDNNKLEKLHKAAQQCGADWLITTQKDWVKLKEVLGNKKETSPAKANTDQVADNAGQLHWLKVEMSISNGEDQLCSLLDGLNLYKSHMNLQG